MKSFTEKFIFPIILLHNIFLHYVFVSCIAPGPPVVPDLTALSSAVMNVSWQQPIEPNGVIMNYSVKFFEKEAETFEDSLSIPKPSTTFAVFENLKPYTLYVAAVKAATSAGYGEWSLLAEKRTDPIGIYVFFMCRMSALDAVI